MLLQSTIPQSPLLHRRVSLSSPLSSHSLSFPSGFRGKKHPAVRCSISQVHSYGTVDYERRPVAKWTGIYKSISLMKDRAVSAVSVLNDCEKAGKKLTKWELHRIIKELRKFRQFNRALEVYEWMNNRAEMFGITTSDTAIQLDLIAKVRGTLYAEDYFLKLPDTSKDKRTYAALLNAYAQAKMREKAESIHMQMIIRGYPMKPLQFNVMMTLYMNLKEYDKVDLLVSEMRQKNVPLDLYSYNIWLSSSGAQGSVENVEKVFQQMEQDSTVNPNWITFGTIASFYIRVGLLEKAEECIKKIESRITGQDRIPYHHVISLYGSLGKREEVYRVWNVCKSIFPNTPMMAYHTMISSLIRLGDVEGAEQLYAEWLSVTPTNNPRIVNLLLSYYTRNGLLVKAEDLVDRMVELGGKPNPVTWEILAEGHIREKKVPEALSCLKEAVLVRGSKNWKPRPVNVSSILSICEQNDDMQSKDVLMGLLSEVGCFEDEAYNSYIPSTGGVATVRDEGEDSYGDEILVNQLQGSFQ
ncbi:hypothetical protein RHMOL_Rhmol07G0045500 [Rhododendron molle]|uniref:Uncharacterized protein n=1 Tax=Rhododendron molle TaxID=49168 RepID=A0ACC0MY57_RHOML|nr:hypothetical protein RHMOL_Rhmol07G0045500 [Rhododendron molle]